MILVIVGPTASGKTALSIDLAKRFNGEIISADSRQVYRGMDIGSGKVTRREMRGIPHHMIDVASPRRIFTAADYQVKAKKIIKRILTKKKMPIIVGGTGFYIDALLYDYALPSVKPNLALRKKLEKKSVDELFSELKKLDPRRAKTIDRHNPRRLIRALEIVISTKRPVPILGNSAMLRKSNYENIIKIGLSPKSEVLEKNIAARLKKRLRAGMVREIERLKKNGVSSKRLEDFGLEYRFINRHLRGLITREEMIDSIKKEILRYAKRQITWFKRDAEIRWVKKPGEAVKILRQYIRKKATWGQAAF